LKTDQTSPAESEARYEPLDVPPLLPFWLACLLGAFVGGVLLYISLVFPLATDQQYRGPLKPLPPAPRLESAPARDFQRYQAVKRQELGGSAHRLPIEAAMRETARQGWGPPK
jgi:hypothetical protein